MQLKDLQIGQRVYDSQKGDAFLVADHGAYGEGVTTLLSERVAGVRCFDAAEPRKKGNRIFAYTDRYGNNNYALSNVHQWLNADGPDWYKPTHEFDEPPVAEHVRYGECPYADMDGYLTGFSDGFKNALVESDIPVLVRKAKERGELTTVKAKVFLPSRTEMNKGSEFGIDEGRPLSIFYDVNVYHAVPTDADMEKYGRSWNPERKGAAFDAPQIYDPKYGWWYYMRTPNLVYAFLLRVMSSYGAVSYTYAYNDVVGVRPLVNMRSDTQIEDNGEPIPSYAIVG